MAGIGRPQERILCVSKSEREELERISRSRAFVYCHASVNIRVLSDVGVE